MAHDLIEAGYGDLITSSSSPANLAEALKATGLDFRIRGKWNIRAQATALTARVAPDGGLGLALIGSFDENSTYILLQGPGDAFLFERSRNYQDTDYMRRWIAIQGLDSIRRTVLGELESPVD